LFRQHLRRVYQTLIEGGRKPRPRRVPRAGRAPATRLAVEGLEDRTLPSILTLTSGALAYAPGTSVGNTLSISDNTPTHRYTLVDTAEDITLVGRAVHQLLTRGARAVVRKGACKIMRHASCTPLSHRRSSVS
jgi:hypothetical protein